MDRFETEPAKVLAELHAGLKPTDDEDKLFALAELSLLHAQIQATIPGSWLQRSMPGRCCFQATPAQFN